MCDRRQGTCDLPAASRKRPAEPPRRGPIEPPHGGPEEDPPDMSPSEVLRAFLRIRKGVARADSDITNLADETELLFDRLRRTLRIPPRTPAAPADASPAPSPQTLQWLARSGAAAVVISWRTDGRADVFIDGYPPIRALPRKLAILLDLLQEDSGQMTDNMVGWKRRETLMAAMAKRTGQPFGPSALTTAINRLRNALAAAGGNSYLLETNRPLGYRFARKAPPPVAAAVQAGGNV